MDGFERWRESDAVWETIAFKVPQFEREAKEATEAMVLVSA